MLTKIVAGTYEENEMNIRERIRLVREGQLVEMGTEVATNAPEDDYRTKMRKEALAILPYVKSLRKTTEEEIHTVVKKLRRDNPGIDELSVGLKIKKIMNGAGFSYNRIERIYDALNIVNPNEVGVYESRGVKNYRKTFEANAPAKALGAVKIIDAKGKVVKSSRNLRGVLDYSRKEVIDRITIAKNEDGSAVVNFYWENGATCEVDFASAKVANKWVKRPVFRGVEFVTISEADMDGTGPRYLKGKNPGKGLRGKANGGKCVKKEAYTPRARQYAKKDWMPLMDLNGEKMCQKCAAKKDITKDTFNALSIGKGLCDVCQPSKR